MPPSIPTFPSSSSSSSPSRSLSTPPIRHPQDLQASTNAPCCGSTTDAILLDLHTTVVIPDYHLYYNAPINSFHPTYHALADGSLVATPFIADMRGANIHLAWTSALAMFFCVTSCTTVQYIRRGKIKKKGLFYLLLVSQLSGVVGTVSLIVPYFDQFVNCKSINILAIACTILSYTLLMTGILGIKAYRCLGNSKFVLVVLVAVRTAAIGLGVLNMTKVTAFRRLTGSCLPSFGTPLFGSAVIAQTIESAFISGCFLYAVLKSSRAEGQGRMSIQVSVRDYKEPKLFSLEQASAIEPEHVPRGWWDYVPDPSQSEAHTHPAETPNPKSNSDHSGAPHTMSNMLQFSNYPPSDAHETMLHRKVSTAGDRISQRLFRAPSLAFSARYPDDHYHDRVRARPRSPAPPSVMSRISKYMPRMQLFREVLRNELAYTVLLTIIYLINGLLMVLGISERLIMDPMGLTGLSWVVVSMFTMLSFGRVVRRHEREAILQHPSAWDPVYRAGLEASRAFTRGRGGRAFSPISVASRVPRQGYKNPSEDIPPVPSMRYRGSSTPLAHGARSVVPLRKTSSPVTDGTRPWMASRQMSVSSTGSYEADVPLTADPSYNNVLWESAVALPSPISSQYPPSFARSSLRSESPQSDNRRLMRPTSLATDPSVRGSRRPSTLSFSRMDLNMDLSSEDHAGL